MIWSTATETIPMQRQTITSHEAKTQLVDLLRRVRGGKGFTITQHGKPVSDLVPAGASVRRAGTRAAARMQTLTHEAMKLESVDIQALIEAGRD